MKDIWNPWHGCIKISEGCENCYMYFLDKSRNLNGSDIYKVKTNFNLPLKKDRQGNYKIKSGEIIRVCMTSDFFLEEADNWRNEVWDIIKERQDVLFFLLTKRIDRVSYCLPKNWGGGWNNVWLNTTAENQKRADERIPVLLNLPFKYKGIVAAPFIEEIDISNYLKTHKINSVIVGGENYDGARPCNYSWVENLYIQCKNENVNFNFFETGTKFIKDNKLYTLPHKIQQYQALKSGLKFKGEPFIFHYSLSSSTNNQPDFLSDSKAIDIFDSFTNEAQIIKCYSCKNKNCSKCSDY